MKMVAIVRVAIVVINLLRKLELFELTLTVLFWSRWEYF